MIRLKYPDFYLYNIYFPNAGRKIGAFLSSSTFTPRLLEICDGAS